MKLITCGSCGAEVIGPVSERYPRGTPYVVRKWTARQYPLITKCRRCGHPIKMTVRDFHALPDMTTEQINKYDMHKHRDLSPKEIAEARAKKVTVPPGEEQG